MDDFVKIRLLQVFGIMGQVVWDWADMDVTRQVTHNR